MPLLPEAEKKALRRTGWHKLPDVLIHAAQSMVKKHPLYDRAKSGDVAAAEGLVQDCLKEEHYESISGTCRRNSAALLAVHALEADGMNSIPRVFARVLAGFLNLPVASGVIQSNSVAHTGATGYHRLAYPALFEGSFSHSSFFLVDDFVGQGGTLANLKGYIESSGGLVVGMTALTGRADSAVLTLTSETLETLRRKHGARLEEWWVDTFGYGLESLTESEAKYLARVDSFDAIRERITDARRGGDR